MTLTFGSLFAGIGGLDLGLERAGMKCRWQVEKDEFCRRVLAKHWPDVPRYEDVRDVGANLAVVDLICGGFPCQDLSHANTRGRRGLRGEKSSLWSEFRRIVKELRPRTVVVENISDGWRNWVPYVRRDLDGLGYASLHIRLRASDVGAPHDRPRVFVVANPHLESESLCAINAQVAGIRTTSRRVQWDGARRPIPVANGVSAGLALRALGNAVVPAVAERIGRMIVDWEWLL